MEPGCLLARKKTILQRTRCYIFILLYILLYLYKNKHRMCNKVQLFFKSTMSYVFFDWTKYLRINILAMAFPWSRFAHTKNEEWPPRETLKVSTILSCSQKRWVWHESVSPWQRSAVSSLKNWPGLCDIREAGWAPWELNLASTKPNLAGTCWRRSWALTD